MTLLLEIKLENTKNFLELENDIEVHNLSIEKIFDFTLSKNDFSYKSELISELAKRGMDNIHERIKIKKLCKAEILNIEEGLSNKDTSVNKESLLKIKLLNIISLSDKLQLEWQKHDLKLNFK